MEKLVQEEEEEDEEGKGKTISSDPLLAIKGKYQHNNAYSRPSTIALFALLTASTFLHF